MYLSINNLDMFQGTNENVSDYGGHSGVSACTVKNIVHAKRDDCRGGLYKVG